MSNWHNQNMSNHCLPPPDSSLGGVINSSGTISSSSRNTGVGPAHDDTDPAGSTTRSTSISATTINSKQITARVQCMLWVHDDRFSKSQVVVHPALLPVPLSTTTTPTIGLYGSRVSESTDIRSGTNMIHGIHHTIQSGDIIEIIQSIGGSSISNLKSSTGCALMDGRLSSGLSLSSSLSNPMANHHHSFTAQPSRHHSETERDKDGSHIKRSAILQVDLAADPELLAKHPTLQISIHQSIATLYELQARVPVSVRRAEKDTLHCDYIELVFKDQYISRSDMWNFCREMVGNFLYTGKRITSALGIRAGVRMIATSVTSSATPSSSASTPSSIPASASTYPLSWNSDTIGPYTSTSAPRSLKYGLVSPSTRIIFRSESAKFFILIQMSKEMWEFDGDGELFFEKCIDGFLPELFSAWKAAGTNHAVSIVLFCRVMYPDEDQDSGLEPALNSNPEYKETLFQNYERGNGDRRKDEPLLPISFDPSGTPCRDFYKVVTDFESRSEWTNILSTLKQAFIQFQKSVLMLRYTSGKSVLRGQISCASHGNFLEAVNLALNPYTKHYVNRDLLRTGLNIILITPGSGHFVVDRKLCRMSNQRVIENGISLDLVSLARPPLFAVPVLEYFSNRPSQPPLPPRAAFGSPPGASFRYPFGHRAGVFEGAGGDTSFLSSNIKDRPIFGSATDVLDPINVDEEVNNTSPKISYYTKPHWIDVSFWSRPMSGTEGFSFQPRVKLSQLYDLDPNVLVEPMVDHENMESYDTSVFVQSQSQSGGGQSGNSPFVQQQSSLRKFPSNATSSLSESPDLLDWSMAQAASGLQTFHIVQPGYKTTNLVEDRQLYTSGGREEAGNMIRRSIKLSSSKSVNSGGRSSMHEEDGSRRAEGLALHNDDPTAYRKSSSSSKLKSLAETKSLVGSEASSPITSQPIRIAKQHRNSYSHNSYDDVSMLHHSFKSSASPRIVSLKNVVNPCVMSSSPTRMSTSRQWEHVYTLPIHSEFSLGWMYWTSLTTPASLPLTTDAFPSLEELQDSFQEYTYTLSASENNFVPASLVMELIGQRLSQGFQLVVSSRLDFIESVKREMNHGQTNASNGTIGPVFLSLGDQIHRIYFDAQGNNVEIKRYVHRPDYQKSPIGKTCAIWSKHGTEYENRRITFTYPTSQLYSWNYFDHLISGFEQEMTENLNFWRARFLLIPLEQPPRFHAFTSSMTTLEDEELRVSGFFKFSESIERCVRSGHAFQVTPMLGDEFYPPSGSTRSSELRYPPSPLTAAGLDLGVWTSLVLTSGLLRSLTWRSMLYESILVGSDLVAWHIRAFSDINTTDAACEFMQNLVEKGILVPEVSAPPSRFVSGFYFYRIPGDQRQTKSDLTLSQPSDRGDATPKMTPFNRPILSPPLFKLFGGTSGSKLAPKQESSTASRNAIPIQLQSRIEVDIDIQKRSRRAETATLLFDSYFNPAHCYHFELNWLLCTPRLIDETVQSWTRAAEKSGFRLVEAPVEQTFSYSDDLPFHGFFDIQLAIEPFKCVSKVSDSWINVQRNMSDDLKGSLGDPPSAHHPSDLTSYSEQSTISIENLSVQNDASHIPVSDQEWEKAISSLLRKFNFVLDIPVHYCQHPPYAKKHFARTFVHRSGNSFIHVQPEQRKLRWIVNRLYWTHLTFNSARNSPSPEIIRAELVQFCGGADTLSDFWSKIDWNYGSSNP